MGGSKKGERRGAARKRMIAADPEAPSTLKRARAVPHKHNEDYMRQIVLAISGVRGKTSSNLPPRELIKEAQDYFHARVNQLLGTLEVLKAHLDAADPNDRPVMEDLDREMRLLEREIGSAYLTAVECAFKNLPYFHPKIQPAEEGETAGTPEQLLRMMMREIDELSRGRPTWMKQDLKLVSSK